MRSTVQLVSILDSVKLCCANDYDDSGYCFGAPFTVELASTNDVVAGNAASRFIVFLTLNLILPSCLRTSCLSHRGSFQANNQSVSVFQDDNP